MDPILKFDATGKLVKHFGAGMLVSPHGIYLDRDGSIFYRRPLNLWQRLKEPIWFFRWIDDRLDGLRKNATKQEKRVGEYYIANENRKYKPYDEAVKRTERIVAMIRKRLPEKTKLVAFSADNYEPQMGEMKRIFEANGAAFYEDPVQLLEKTMFEQKLALKAVDNCHWSEQGQVVIARGLLPHLKEVLSFESRVSSSPETRNPKPETRN